MSDRTEVLETATRQSIDRKLLNLGWAVDEFAPGNNVTTGRARTQPEARMLRKVNSNGAYPDYVLYDSESWKPLAVLEAKRPGSDMRSALKQACAYAAALGCKVAFAVDGGLTEAVWVDRQEPLRDKGLTVNELLTESKLKVFCETGEDIIYAPAPTKTREDLIRVFKKANELLRQQGMREGLERFTEFSNLLFLKLIDEIELDRKKRGEAERVEERYRWSKFKGKEAEDMLDYINDTVLPKLVNKYNHSGDVFSPWLGISDPEILKKIVDELDSLTLLDVDSDIKGDAFEYFLKNSVSVGNDLGEYYTPRHIVKLMVELADPKFGDTVYDPCCGTGGFLIEAFRHIKLACSQTPENIKILEKKTIYGNELTGTAKLAKMNMILAGDGHANIKQQDSLEHPAKKKHNIVLSNFPFNQRTQFSNYYGMSSQDANPVFLAHIMQALAENGRAAVVVPDSSLYSTNIAAVSVRKRLLTQFSVIAVIQLDPFVFAPYTRQPTSIVVFENRKSDDPVYFFEVINDGYAKGARRIPVKSDDLPLLRQSWTTKEESDQSFNISRDVIAENNYVLFMNAYKPRTTTGNSVKMSELVDEIVIGETPPRSQHDHFLGSIPWAKIADLGSDKLADTSEKLTEEAVASISPSKEIPPGSLLMSFKLSIGKTSITAASIYTNEAVCWLKLKDIYDDVETIRYLYHILPTLDYSPYAVRSAKGVTLNSTSILNVDIPFPDKKRRGQAVKALDQIAKKIQKKHDEIAELRSSMVDTSRWLSDS